MKTTVQALKELYAKLGGDLADVALIDRVPDMIEALNSIAVAVPAPTAEDEGKVITVGEEGELGFADALPPVTSDDAGKVLMVDEQGAWNPAEASGGGYPIFDFNIDIGISSGTITPGEGVTVSNVLDALSNGPAIAKLKRSNDWYYYLFITKAPTIRQAVIEVYREQKVVNGTYYEYMCRFTGSGQNEWLCTIIGRYEYARV